MKTLYIECNMGAAGDMLTAALLELHPDPEGFLRRLNALNIPDVRVKAESSVKCGITGTRVVVTVHGEEESSPEEGHLHNDDQGHEHHHHEDEHSHEHRHSGMHEIGHIIAQLELSDKVKNDVLAVYGLIAEAESHAHGKPVEQIHFHEVGTMDAIADIVGVCLLMEDLAPDRIIASPVHVGSGQIRCAHGILPVPAPATAYILNGVPAYGGSIRGELCTPTGAALLKHFVSDFGNMPVMKVSKIGYGMGKKDFVAANCTRVMLGETDDGGDEIVELCCNLDDMTPEAIGFAQEQLFEGGALDVYTAAIGMKKNRPGVLLSCICRPGQRKDMITLMFRHTSTLGIREYVCRRYTLHRTHSSAQTKYGPVRIKEASGWGVKREKPEYEDIARIAKEQGLPFTEVTQVVKE